jgi:hypothetical protein
MANVDHIHYAEGRVYIDPAVAEKYPYKTINVYEEDGVGKVVYYVLSDSTPRKFIANHIFKDNPSIMKVYMALRDWVSYSLIEDLRRERRVVVFTRQSAVPDDQ